MTPERLPPNQRLTEKWPVLHCGPVPRTDERRWVFRVNGLTEHSRELALAEFLALPRIVVEADFHCVTGWSRTGNRWEGIPVREVLRLAPPLPRAKHVLVHGPNGYCANLSLDDFTAPENLFATHHDGEPLTPEHGGPVRLIVPSRYGWKSVKWACGMEYLATERPGYWEQRGYHLHGDPWREERYRPR